MTKNITMTLYVSLSLKAKLYAERCHSETNHFYDGKPYTFHLEMVTEIANRYMRLLPVESEQIVLAACWAHDIIEDTRQTYNDVKKVLGKDVAEIVYAVTNEKGKTRNERENEKYYYGIRNNSVAAFVKICDRIANAKHSKETNSSMIEVYRKELDHFIHSIDWYELYEPMYKELSDILKY